MVEEHILHSIRTSFETEAIQNRINNAENRLQNLSWDSKVKKGWNFDKYDLAHKDQHITLEKLADFAYSGVDDGSRIRHFIQGISDTSFTPVMASLSTKKGTKIFDSVVEACKTFITQQQLHSRFQAWEVNVAAMSASTGNWIKEKLKKIDATDNKYSPNADYSAFKIPHWFYKTDEWNKLNCRQRNYLHQKPQQKSNWKNDKE